MALSRACAKSGSPSDRIEFDRALRKHKILDRNLVLFRTTGGQAIALNDRCAHRSYPLSASKLDGDTIVCGYHGLRYNAAGVGGDAEVSQEAVGSGVGGARDVALWSWTGCLSREGGGRGPLYRRSAARWGARSWP
jgi:Rieske [2Fe-2S] domain